MRFTSFSQAQKVVGQYFRVFREDIVEHIYRTYGAGPGYLSCKPSGLEIVGRTTESYASVFSDKSLSRGKIGYGCGEFFGWNDISGYEKVVGAGFSRIFALEVIGSEIRGSASGQYGLPFLGYGCDACAQQRQRTCEGKGEEILACCIVVEKYYVGLRCCSHVDNVIVKFGKFTNFASTNNIDMQFTETDIKGVWLIEPKRFGDSRGYFMESFRLSEFEAHVGHVAFVQDNESLSHRGVLRGLHMQRGEWGQAKLVRVSHGRVLDVNVDLRPGSPTFGRHVAVELSHENGRQLFVPRGFAHGFVVLSDTAQFQYKVDNYYHPEAECTLRYDDPALGIDWVLPESELDLSEKDRRGLPLSDFS